MDNQDNRLKGDLKISVIIPCYNSERTIGYVVDRILDTLRDWCVPRIILVNDHSKDNVWNIISEICRIHKNVIGLSLSRNFGQQAARMAALPYANGDYIVFMDDDGQHDPGDIRKLISKAEEGYDIVYAFFRKKKEHIFRVLGSDFARKTVDLIMSKPKDVHQSSFFAVRPFLTDELRNYRSPSPVILGYFMQITKNIAEVEIEHHERRDGRSGYTFKKLVGLWLDLFTSFSVLPLRIASLTGVCFSLAGLIMGMVFVIKKLALHMAPVGYTSLISVVLFSSGVIMLMLGMIGEYIGRMFITLNDVPQYVVKESINTDIAEGEESCTKI